MTRSHFDDLAIPYRALAAAWSAGLVGVVVLGGLDSLLSSGAVDLGWLLERRVQPALLWAAASPLLFGLGARYRLRGPGAAAAWGLHVAVFATWMVVSNVIIRLPGMVLEGRSDLLPDAVEGAVEHGPAAALLYLLLVGCGRVHAGNTHGAVDPGPSRLALENGYRIRLVSLDEVRWLEADRDHVRVHLADGRAHRVRATMKEMATKLDDDRFVRIHRSSIVNLDHLREIQPYFHGDHVAILDDGTELRIPRTRQAALNRILDWRS